MAGFTSDGCSRPVSAVLVRGVCDVVSRREVQSLRVEISMAELKTNMIEADLPCAVCGYNLRTLDPAGRCPECGHAVFSSIAKERFRQSRLGRPINQSDPGWLKSLIEGTVALLA